MISAFGVEHGEISKADAISDEAKAKRRAITARGQKQARDCGELEPWARLAL